MKVALIQTPADLGAYPNLFGDTQNYANLLAKEIAFNSKPHLLVVMPTGFGGTNLGANVDSALKGIKIDAAAKSDGLAQAALVAAARIATANGHQTPVPPEANAALAASKASSKRSTPSVLVYGGPVLLALIAIGALIWVGRRKEREGDEDGRRVSGRRGREEVAEAVRAVAAVRGDRPGVCTAAEAAERAVPAQVGAHSAQRRRAVGPCVRTTKVLPPWLTRPHVCGG